MVLGHSLAAILMERLLGIILELVCLFPVMVWWWQSGQIIILPLLPLLTIGRDMFECTNTPLSLLLGLNLQLGSDIDGEAKEDRCGRSVSLPSDGMVVAVGAAQNNPTSTKIDAGHVRVYRYVNNAWAQLGGDIEGESSEDWTGRSVSLSSDGMIVAVGAPYTNDPTSAKVDAGHV